MDEALSSSSEWMHLYQQTIDTSFGSSDANTLTNASCATSRSDNLNPGSPVVAAEHLRPKGCISKPTRRRSRASKRTATTLVNADAKSFRSLVQQYTGCRRRSASISFGNPRGPVNINFALVKEHDYHSTDHASLIPQPSVQNICSWQQQEEHQRHYQQEQLSNEEQECDLSFDSVRIDDDFLLTSSCFPRSGSEIPHGFVLDDLYFLA